MINIDISTQPTDTEEQYRLGLLYATGTGVPQDYDQAVKWYTKSAEQGHPTAQYNLGVMYENGIGVIKDSEQAAKWYTKSWARFCRDT